jgi:hypothetical protein
MEGTATRAFRSLSLSLDNEHFEEVMTIQVDMQTSETLAEPINSKEFLTRRRKNA